MKENDKIKSQQYDKFFKTLLSKTENAKSLIEFTLELSCTPIVNTKISDFLSPSCPLL